jgi:hypothetical protein
LAGSKTFFNSFFDDKNIDFSKKSGYFFEGQRLFLPPKKKIIFETGYWFDRILKEMKSRDVSLIFGRSQQEGLLWFQFLSIQKKYWLDGFSEQPPVSEICYRRPSTVFCGAQDRPKNYFFG